MHQGSGKKPHEYSDEELLEIYGNPDAREYAFDLIVHKFQEKLYWHIRKILINHDDTDDILQNTFIKAWNGLSSFRRDSGLYTWLYRIATNEALTFLRQKKRKYMLPLVNIEKRLSDSLNADEYFNGDDLQMQLQYPSLVEKVFLAIFPSSVPGLIFY